MNFPFEKFLIGWQAVPLPVGAITVLEGAPWDKALPWTLVFQLIGLIGLMAKMGISAWGNGTIIHKREVTPLYVTIEDQNKTIRGLNQQIIDLYRTTSQAAQATVGLAEVVAEKAKS